MENKFNLKEFKNGKLAINGLNQKVKFVTETRGQMMVSVLGKFGRNETMKMELDGKKYSFGKSFLDLVGMYEVA